MRGSAFRSTPFVKQARKNYDNYFLDLIKACGSINNHELGLKALREYGYQHYTPVMLPHMQMHSNYVLLCVFSRHLRIYVKLFEYYSKSKQQFMASGNLTCILRYQLNTHYVYLIGTLEYMLNFPTLFISFLHKGKFSVTS